MPELPEVETIRSQLVKQLPFKINLVTVTTGFKKNILKTVIPKNLCNLEISDIQRHGKMMFFIFTNGQQMLTHLGMTGTWLFGFEKDIQKKISSHTHFIIHGSHKSKKMILAYDDPRRFGKIYFYNQEQALNKISQFSIDLLDPNFTVPYLKNQLGKFPNRMLKVTLLDQKLFAGSGNYIASEICARAGIRPTRLCKDIKEIEVSKIHQAIKKVILPAVKLGGTTFQGGYRDSSGNKGLGISHLIVFYQKKCQNCKTTEVKKIILATRGTYYCEKCQK